MSILSAFDLAELVAIDEDEMAATGVIKRKTSVSDGKGGHTATWATIATVKCRLMVSFSSQAGDSEIAGRMTNTANFQIRFPVGTDVRNTDTITIGTRVFEVIKALAHTYQTSLRVAVVEVT